MTDNENPDILSAKHTIDKEIEALRMMEGNLNDSLSKALDIMQKTEGRVIYRYTVIFRASGGSQSWRSRYDYQKRLCCCHFKLRGNQRTFRHFILLQTLWHPAYRYD